MRNRLHIWPEYVVCKPEAIFTRYGQHKLTHICHKYTLHSLQLRVLGNQNNYCIQNHWSLGYLLLHTLSSTQLRTTSCSCRPCAFTCDTKICNKTACARFWFDGLPNFAISVLYYCCRAFFFPSVSSKLNCTPNRTPPPRDKSEVEATAGFKYRPQICAMRGYAPNIVATKQSWSLSH